MTRSLLPGLFRKKPVVVEAIKWDNSMKVYTFLYHWTPKPIVSAFHPDESLMVETLEGWMKASRGDWIIKGVKGELYPCKPDIFKATYERAEISRIEREEPRCKVCGRDDCYGCGEGRAT